ncbi:glucose PTS transporter transcription antiterminator GlcT [Bacillus sp. B-jedd]|uniref:glucose PTS transporter transcription antiterminator GlcT n=1 Tax=Bacillus sp. B-jedd TaxID=1476857 RepID=UPI0005155500|nr:transcription antiterminator [Bacillus sp. B-jedd]CEG25396.1 transcriptional antiterminator BglG [Bacillus sp. B-jedd]
MSTMVIQKILNNNVLIAENPEYGEVVLIGKGIGFNRKPREFLDPSAAEKVFVLKNEKEQQNYIKLLPFLEENLQQLIISAIELIKKEAGESLNEHIHVALTDHLMFTVSRVANGLEIRNPFLVETKALYPLEYRIAKDVLQLFEEIAGIVLPEGEAGFIALHIHSAMTNRELSEVNQYSQLVTTLVQMIEGQLGVNIDKDSIDYMRLVRHLRFAIERVKSGEKVEEPEAISALLKKEYPVCYNLSWKLIKVMQQTLKMPVYDAEAVYLTMHLQRLQKKTK